MLDWISGTVAGMSYFGIMLPMFLENLFPPIPSELIMPLAGFTAARGDLGFAGVVLAGMAGSVLGVLPWYYAGRLLGAERLTRLAGRHGRWLTVSSDDVDEVCAWFNRHGGKAVFLGRLVPTVRTLISVPAGIARMNLARFLIYSAVGTLLWAALLAYAGYLLESQYSKVADYAGLVSKIIIGLIVLAYLYRVITFTGSSGGQQ